VERVEMGGLGNGYGPWAAKGNLSSNRKLSRFPVALRSRAPFTLTTGWLLTGVPAAEKTWQAMRTLTRATVRANPFEGRILGEEYNLLHSLVTSSLSGPNVFLSAIFSNTLSPCFSINVNEQVSHP